MSANHLKTPFNDSMQAWGKGKVNDGLWGVGKSYPVSVTEVIGSGVVEVKFEVNADPYTLPKVKVPILYPEYIRYPIQVGDRGLVVSASVRIGGASGLGSGVPDLSTPGNLSAMAFLWLGQKDWSDPIDPDAVELYGVGDSGVILHDGNNTVTVTLTASGIVIDTGGNDVTINGGGSVTVNDGGDVVAGGISLTNHTHSGVDSGPDDTGPPNP